LLNEIIVVLLSLIVILLLILTITLLKNRKKESDDSLESKEELVNSLKNASNSYNIRVFSLPEEIEKLSNKQIRDITKKIFRVFEALDYKNSNHDYNSNTWHSWQVGLLLAMYKRDLELFIPNKEHLFKDEVIDQSESSLRDLMNKVLIKYKSEVKVTLGKERLSKNLIWSGQEVSIILYFLSRYKYF